MKAGFLQFKPKLCDVNSNISKVSKLIDKFNINVDLLVLPELSNSGYLFTSAEQAANVSEFIPNGVFTQFLLQLSSDKNMFIVSGICEKYNNKLYNSAVLTCPDGNFFLYRKTHLFMEEKLWFTPGNTGLNAFEIAGDFGKAKIGIMICFDWIFPEAARTLMLKGAQIIAHPSNLILQYCQKAMFARAVENRVFTVTANRIGTDTNNGKSLTFTGNSVIVDPKGNYLCSAPENIEYYGYSELDLNLADNKFVTEMNNIIDDRRKEFYL